MEYEHELDLVEFKKLNLGDGFSNSVGQEMAYVPAGSFTYALSDRKAVIPEGLYVARTVTTQGSWYRALGSQPWIYTERYSRKYYRDTNNVRDGDDYPAVYVNYEDATTFCEKLNELESKQRQGTQFEDWEYRLLTEEEWEYVCRAGSTTAYHFGDDVSQLEQYAWYNQNAWNANEQYAHRVAMKRPNQFGLFDMHGGVWEWTWGDGRSHRLLRGGSFSRPATDCRTDAYIVLSKGQISDSIGFRIAFAPRQPEKATDPKEQ